MEAFGCSPNELAKFGQCWNWGAGRIGLKEAQGQTGSRRGGIFFFFFADSGNEFYIFQQGFDLKLLGKTKADKAGAPQKEIFASEDK